MARVPTPAPVRRPPTPRPVAAAAPGTVGDLPLRPNYFKEGLEQLKTVEALGGGESIAIVTGRGEGAKAGLDSVANYIKKEIKDEIKREVAPADNTQPAGLGPRVGGGGRVVDARIANSIATLSEIAAGTAGKPLGAEHVGVAGGVAPVFAFFSDYAGSNLTLTEDHNNHVVECTTGGALTVTVPGDLPAAFVCGISRKVEGDVTFSGSGIEPPDGTFGLNAFQFVSVVVKAEGAIRLYGV